MKLSTTEKNLCNYFELQLDFDDIIKYSLPFSEGFLNFNEN